MRSPTLSIGAAFFLAAASTALGQSPSAESAAPHLRRDGPAVQLVVDGKPFLILGGELLNSSSSSREHMQAVWPRLAAMSLNTVLTPVSWDMIEPAEGRYDFRLVDGLIQDARAQNLHLVLLWLASWKNGMSCYMPLWVKQDCDRFPRVPDGSGAGRELLSTLSDANRNADARAFAALMRHLRGFDGSAHTVLMIQVENEVGILGDSRDRSVAANSAFAAPVPAALMSYLEEHRDALLPELRTLWDGAGGKASGSWQEVFGPGLATDEIFMAWNYARYVGYVAAAGKAEYALPMYANAWLRQPYFLTPGTYPSGGPQAELMDVWHAGAPAIDILAPDLYGPNFTEWCFKYQREGNPLFLPETESGPEAGARVFYVLGAHDGLGFSPFGIDMPAERLGPDLGQSYAILSQLAPLILESRGLGRMTGFVRRLQPGDRPGLYIRPNDCKGLRSDRGGRTRRIRGCGKGIHGEIQAERRAPARRPRPRRGGYLSGRALDPRPAPQRRRDRSGRALEIFALRVRDPTLHGLPIPLRTCQAAGSGV